MKAGTTNVKGDEELARTCHRAADDLGHMESADALAGRAVLGRAQGRTPRVSGALLRSLAVDTSGPGVVVASSLVYAPVIHNGWAAHNISANPFLRDALDGSETLVRSAYLSEVRKDIDRVKGA